MANFAQAISQARRKAAISGRPLSQSDIAGVTSGYARESTQSAIARGYQDVTRRGQDIQAKTAADRIALERSRLAQEAGLFQQKLNFEDKKLQAQLRLGEAELSLASKDQDLDLIGGLAGGIAGLAGSLIKPTHLCTEYTNVANHTDDAHQKAYANLREYAKQTCPNAYRYYLAHAPHIIQGIRNAHSKSPEYSEWWNSFYRNTIRPMLSAADDLPYQNYINHVKDVLFPLYAPEFADGCFSAYWDDINKVLWDKDDRRLKEVKV